MNAANQKRIRQGAAGLRAWEHIRARHPSYRRNRKETRSQTYHTETDIIDMVADLYHYAQSENVDVEAVARQAMAHFKAELIADTSDEVKSLSDRTIPN
jgi:DNA-binding ferritin-like protein (Dps family)